MKKSSSKSKISKITTTTTVYYQTGKNGRSHKDLLADAKRKAKLPGKRVSASGNVYYERRANRSDLPGERKNYSERHGRK